MDNCSKGWCKYFWKYFNLLQKTNSLYLATIKKKKKILKRKSHLLFYERIDHKSRFVIIWLGKDKGKNIPKSRVSKCLFPHPWTQSSPEPNLKINATNVHMEIPGMLDTKVTLKFLKWKSYFVPPLLLQT